MRPASLYTTTLLLTLTPIRLAFADCQCPPMSAKEQTATATYVFNGDVWDVEIDGATKKKVITLDVNDTFKGKPAERLEVRDNEDGKDCATDFHEGETYLVYARWQWGMTQTSRCWGTKKIQEAMGDASALGPSAALKGKYYAKLREACMGRRDTPCCLYSVKAMSDGGYLPQPEGGCPEETIPDLLRCAGSYTWCVPATDTSRHNQKRK